METTFCCPLRLVFIAEFHGTCLCRSQLLKALCTPDHQTLVIIIRGILNAERKKIEKEKIYWIFSVPSLWYLWVINWTFKGQTIMQYLHIYLSTYWGPKKSMAKMSFCCFYFRLIWSFTLVLYLQPLVRMSIVEHLCSYINYLLWCISISKQWSCL